MRWQGKQKSDNVEDRRNMRVSGSGSGNSGNMLRLLPVAVKFLGFKGTAILVICVGAYGLFSGNLGTVLGALGMRQDTSVSVSTEPFQETAKEKELMDFVAVVLADTEATWGDLFRQNFTHGSSAQRVQWCKTGLASGETGSCDTFSQ